MGIVYWASSFLGNSKYLGLKVLTVLGPNGPAPTHGLSQTQSGYTVHTPDPSLYEPIPNFFFFFKV